MRCAYNDDLIIDTFDSMVLEGITVLILRILREKYFFHFQL